jgi:hypothetical protein
MSVRMRMAVISLGVVAVACSAVPPPGQPGTPVSRISTPPEPGVSWLRVAPQEGLRGATVSLDVACLDNLGTVHSPVLDIGALQADPAGHQPWHLTGTATVHSDAAPGQYPISATCGSENLSAVFTVVPHP